MRNKLLIDNGITVEIGNNGWQDTVVELVSSGHFLWWCIGIALVRQGGSSMNLEIHEHSTAYGRAVVLHTEYKKLSDSCFKNCLKNLAYANEILQIQILC